MTVTPFVTLLVTVEVIVVVDVAMTVVSRYVGALLILIVVYRDVRLVKG